MAKLLKKIYVFLFVRYDVLFMRFCFVMLIPCALSELFCRWWLCFMSFILSLVTYAKHKNWNRSDDNG